MTVKNLSLTLALTMTAFAAQAENHASSVRLPLCIYDSCSFVNEHGEKVLTGYDAIEPFSENGLALVQINGEHSKFIDRNGNTVISLPLGWSAWPFQSNGLARVKIGNEGYTFIDISGEPISDLRFASATDFDSAGMALVDNGQYQGFLSEDGSMAIPLKLDLTLPFSKNGLAVSWSGTKVGYIDRSGEWALPPIYENASSFRDNGFAKVSKDGRSYILSSGGETVREPEADGRQYMSFGKYPSSDPKTGKYGYKGNEGDWVIEPKFDYALSFRSNGLAQIRQYGDERRNQVLWGLIDTQGDWVAEPKYADFCVWQPNGMISFKPGSYYEDESNTLFPSGFLNMRGDEVLPPIFEACGKALDEKYLIVEFGFRKSYYGVVDAQGRMYGFTKEDVVNTSRDTRQ